MRRRASTLVLSRRQTSLLLSPARLEILEALGTIERASARELAARVGRPPGAVYHHVRVLAEAGLIVEAGLRRGSRRPEVVYVPAAARLAVAAGGSPPDDQQALRTFQAVLRQAGRDVETAFARGPATLKGRFYSGQASAALTPREVKRVIALLEQIETLMRRARGRRTGRADDVYRWTGVLVPLGRKRS